MVTPNDFPPHHHKTCPARKGVAGWATKRTGNHMIIAIFACGFMLAALTYTTWTVFTEHQLDHHHATTIRENNTK